MAQQYPYGDEIPAPPGFNPTAFELACEVPPAPVELLRTAAWLVNRGILSEPEAIAQLWDVVATDWLENFPN